MPELAGSCFSVASTVNSGERRNNSAARSNAAPSTCNDRESPEIVLHRIKSLVSFNSITKPIFFNGFRSDTSSLNS